MKSQLLSKLKFVIGWPLTLVAFIFLANIIIEKYTEIIPHLSQTNHSHILIGLLFLILFYFVRSFLWWEILKMLKYNVSFKKSTYFWAISEVKRYIPGNIWSFIGRAVLFEDLGVKKIDITKGLLYEALFFVIGSVVISLLGLPLVVPAQYILLITSFVIAGILLFAYHKVWFPLLSKNNNKTFSFIFPQTRPGEILKLSLISASAILFFAIGNYFIMTSLFITDIQLFWQLVGVFAIALVVGYLSFLTPAGFGVREAVLVAVLTNFTSVTFATFLALFTRAFLVISELIFILLSYLWVKIKNKYLTKFEKIIIQYPYQFVLSIAALFYTLYFTNVTFLRYENFYTGRFDLGNMAQTVWNTAHGNIFMLTNPNGTEQISRLAFHADFILVLLAPFYILWEDPRMLLLIQTIIIALGSFFVFYLAKFVVKNNMLSLAIAFAYLLNPSVQRTNLYDFHAVTLATTFMLATFYFFSRKKYFSFVLFGFLAALCKEQLWLFIALFGLTIAIVHKKRLFGNAIMLVSLSMFYFLFWYAIPHTLGSQHFALSYLSDFGDSPTKIITSFLFSPDKLIATINEADRLHFVRQLLSPLGYLSLFFPFPLIFAGPDIMISLLSNNTQLHQIYYQYTATITPFIFVSAIYGVSIIKKFFKTIPYFILISYVIGVSFYAAYSFGPLPGSQEPDIKMITRPLQNKDFINAYLLALPQSVSVASTNNIGSHLSHREVIYTIPQGIGRADQVIILLDKLGNLKTQKEEKLLVENLKNNQNYRLTTEKGDFFVFTKTQ